MSNSKRLQEFFDTHTLGHGLGTEETPCTIAALNLAITGRLTDITPDCASEVLCAAVRPLQDAIPLDMLNSLEWKGIAHRIEGTGRAHEAERLEIILEWVWGVVLPERQVFADESGFGAEWRRMCHEHTAEAAWLAMEAAAARASEKAVKRLEKAATAARAAAILDAMAQAVAAAELAARAAVELSREDHEFWDRVDPCGLLLRLIEVSEGER